MRALLLCSLFLAHPAFAGDAPTPTAAASVTLTAAASPAKPAPPEASVADAMTALNSQPFSVEMHVKSNGEEIVMKRSVDGPKTRMDITSKGMNQTIIVLGDDKKTMVTLDRASKRAMKMSSATVMEKMGRSAPAASDDAGATAPQGGIRLVGHEAIDGRPADKFEVDYGDQGKGTMWVDAEKNLPVHMEAQGNTIDFKNYRIGPQPADAFEVPKGYEVTDMDQMMA